MAELVRCKLCGFVTLRAGMGGHRKKHRKEVEAQYKEWEETLTSAKPVPWISVDPRFVESLGFTTWAEFQRAKKEDRKPTTYATERELKFAVVHHLIE